jgi:HEAT repeat protein
VLAEALKDQDVHVRRFAADALGVVGPAAADAVSALAEALKDQDALVRRIAADALDSLHQKS